MLCHNPKLQSVVDKINGASTKFHNPVLKSLVSESGELFNELILRPDDPGNDHMLVRFSIPILRKSFELEDCIPLVRSANSVQLFEYDFAVRQGKAL